MARLGVVAIGRNEGDRLIRCLDSLAGAGVPIVYVDSASTDDSVAAARARGAIVVALDMTRPFTAARARAEGFDALMAHAPDCAHVQFIDGDCEVEPGWLATATAALDADPQRAAVCGRRRERFPEATRWNALADAEWNTPVGPALACGGDAMMRVAAYRAVGGFDPAVIAGEEPELCARLRGAGWTIARLDAPMTIHDAAMTRAGQWWQRAVRSGFGYAQAYAATGSLYRAELVRAAFWGAGVPVAALIAGLAVHPALSLAWPVLWGVQIARLATRHGLFRAGVLTIFKLAEAQGMARFAWRRVKGATGGTISYK